MTPDRIWIHPADSLQLYVTQEMPDTVCYRREQRLSKAVELLAACHLHLQLCPSAAEATSNKLTDSVNAFLAEEDK